LFFVEENKKQGEVNCKVKKGKEKRTEQYYNQLHGYVSHFTILFGYG
jgi:hypothetical protein